MKKLLFSIALIMSAFTNTKAQSLNFDGQNDYVSVGNILPASYTKEAWIYATASTGSDNIISGGGDGQHAFWAPNLILSAGHNGAWGTVADNTPLNLNQWYHVAVTYDSLSQMMKLYKNGVLISSATNVSDYVGGNMVRLGAYSDADNLFAGNIDEVRIWNVIRTQAEIQNSMNCSLTGAQPGLIVNYNFNEGVPNANNTALTPMITDISGNSNNGILNNFALNGTTSNWVDNVNTLNPVAYATISTSTTTIGAGTTVTFTAIPVNGGATPTYQWMKNNVNVGTTDTYTDNALVNKDTITCLINSSIACLSHDSISNKIGITVANLAAALNFDGVDDYVATNGNITHGNVFTYEAWLNLAMNPVDWMGIVTSSTTGSQPEWVQMSVTSSGYLRTEIGDGLGNTKQYDGTTVLTGSWHHVAMTFDGTNLILYVDGVQETVNQNSDNVLNPFTINTQLYIGAERNLSSFTNATIDEVHIWNTARTAAEVQNDMGCTSPSATTGLVASYNFNEGTPNDNNTGLTTLTDNSGNGHNATLINFDLSGGPISNWTDDVNMLTQTPVITITGTTSICSGTSTTLTANGTATSYTWSANAASAATATVSVSPNTTDTYTLTSANGTCLTTNTVAVNVTATPTITVSGNTTICSGQTTTLTAHGATNYTWSPGNIHVATVPVPTLTASASFTLTGRNGTCSSTITSSINVNPLPTVSVTSQAICAGNTATLTATGTATSYTWNTGANTVSITATPTAALTSYTLTGADANCTNTTVATVTVNSLPTVSVTSQAICAGNTATLTATGTATSYTWSTGANTASITATPTATTTDYTLTVADANCTNMTVATVTVNSLPSISINGAGAICAGTTATLTATGTATSYTWSTGANTSSITATPTAATTGYTLTGADANCTNMAVATVTVNSLPTLSVTAGPAVCGVGTITLTATGTATSYTWSTGANTASISPTLTVTTNYTVTASDANCSNMIVGTATINPVPTLTVIPTTICAGNTATLTATGSATSYTWSTGATTASITPTLTTTTDYTVKVTGANNCVDSAAVLVTVNSSPNITFNVSPSTFCSTDPAAALTANPTGGTFSGTGVSGSTFNPSTAGVGTYTITYTYTDGNSCTATDNVPVTVQICTGINSFANTNSISTYPNPTTGDFYIMTNTAYDNAMVEVYDMIGQKVMIEKLQNNTTRVNLSNLNNAVYQVRVINNNTLIYQSKVVKQQ